MVAAGTGAGLATLELFPLSKSAHAAAGYELDPVCYINDEDTTQDLTMNFPGTNWGCTVGCGPSLASSAFCTTVSGFNGEWHKDDGTTWRLRPDECTGSRSTPKSPGAWDGWKWAETGCTGCSATKYFRCHDGEYKELGVWQPSICQYTVCL